MAATHPQVFEMSPQQRRLWALQQRHGGHTGTTSCDVSIQGPLDTGRLQRAFDLVVARHEMLRTTFHRPAGLPLPLQQVSGASPLVIEHISDAREAEETSPLMWDLTRGPLLQVQLRAQGPERHVMHVRVPIVLSDRRGLENLIADVAIAYGHPQTTSWAGEPVQYPDAAVLLNDLLQEGDRQAPPWDDDAIEALLEDASPIDGRRVSTSATGPARIEAALSAGDVQRAREVARRLNCEVEDLFLTCWLVLLWHCAPPDTRAGTGVAIDGRADPNLRDAIGCFESVLPLWLEGSASQPFSATAKSVTRHLSQLRQRVHQLDPSRVHSDNDTRDVTGIRLWRTAFEHVHTASPLAAGPLTFTPVRFHTDATGSRLLLSVSTAPAAATLVYDPCDRDAAEVEALARAWSAIVDQVLNDPRRPIGAITPTGPADRIVLLDNGVRADAAVASHLCIHELFEREADAQADEIAVVDDATRLTYRELNERANALAERLRAHGASAERRCALFMRRGVDFVVAILGVLKTGAAYVPIDLSTPDDRAAWILKDSRAMLVVTDRHSSGRLPVALPVIEIDGIGRSSHPPAAPVSPRQTAYVIYTSGSTGRPKGVAVEHRQVVNYVLALAPKLPSARSRFALVSSFAADLGHTMVYGALCTGSRLYIVGEDTALSGTSLVEYMDVHAIDCLKITPSHLQGLLTPENASRLVPPMLVLGGEASSWEWLSHVQTHAPGCTLLNHFGPTETTIGCCTYDVPPLESCGAKAGTVPIGAPIDGASVYVLNRYGQLVPPGVPGELCVAGAGVGRGYEGQPAPTAERFVADPFSLSPGARMYRTGDRVRWLPDGVLEFLGRTDRQVKIRGVRIELAEIEAILHTHPGVRQCAAVVEDDADRGRMLVVYIVARTESALHHEALRDFLRARLPEQMMPSEIVMLGRMPMLPNGKIALRALTRASAAPVTAVLDEPATPVGGVIASIWSGLLRHPVGASSNFFSVGGHSLLAMQVVSRIRELLGAEVPLRAIFEHPVLADLASYVESARLADAGMSSSVMTALGDVDTAPLSFAQQRLWFLDQLEPGSSVYNIAFAERLIGILRRDVLDAVLTEIVRRHAVLRTTFPSPAGQAIQKIHPPEPIEVALVDLSGLRAETAAHAAQRAAAAEASRPFNLSRGPLLRARLLRLGPEEHVLLLTLHHIVGDGWSVQVLIRECTALYAALAAGRSSPLPALPVQYADYAVWQRGWLKDDVLEAHLEYWRTQLADVPPLQLAADRRGTARSDHRGLRLPVVFPPGLSTRLAEFSVKHGATRFITLFATFELLLARVTGQTDFAIGVPIANRTRKEIEPLIGFFVNTLALRARVSMGESFEALVCRVRAAMLDAHTHQDLPFEKLVEALAPERNLTHSPLFQVVFQSLDRPGESGAMPGLRFAGSLRRSTTSTFDLTLSMGEDGGSLEVSTDLFSETAAQQLCSLYLDLLASALERPSWPVAALPLVCGEERDRLLVGLNPEIARDGRAPLAVDVQIAQRAQETPQAIAISMGGQSMTYADFMSRADCLAARLRELGARLESPVAILSNRDLHLPVAWAGILRAGAVCVPLDPASLRQRGRAVLDDAAPCAVVTTRALQPHLPPTPAPTVVLDDLFADAALTASGAADAAPDSRLERRASASPHGKALGCIFYTSGTTGTPKAVGVPCEALAGYVDAIVARLALGPRDRVLQFAAVGFDVAVEEMLPALCCGATIVPVGEHWPHPGAELCDLLARERITVCELPTAYWQQWVEQIVQENLSVPATLRAVLVGGERMSAESVRAWQRLGLDLIHVFGLTETAVTSTTHHVTADRLVTGNVPIGRALANTQIYVLDDALEPVPAGSPGELYIGGSGLGRGYLRDPMATGARFLPHPFATTPGERLYRTGDRVRWNDDGEIEWLDRTDQQIKVRGYRVETGEVEAALAAHPAVAQAVVCLHERAGEESRLVAYCIPRPAQTIDPLDVRRTLDTSLPPYMMPSAIMTLDRLPLGAHGKVDRNALPPPVWPAAAAAPAPRPVTRMEATCLAIWQDVLDVDAIAVSDDFFALGGHSLLATRVISRLRQQQRVSVPLRTIFEHSTLAAFAAAVQRLQTPQLEDAEIEAVLAEIEQLPDTPRGHIDGPELHAR